MTEKVAKYTSESDDESENKPKFQVSTLKLFQFGNFGIPMQITTTIQ